MCQRRHAAARGVGHRQRVPLMSAASRGRLDGAGGCSDACGSSHRRRVRVMATSKKDASLASKQLADKKSTKAQKSVAASDLAQTKKSKRK